MSSPEPPAPPLTFGENELRLLERVALIVNSIEDRQTVLERLMDLFLAAMSAERGMLLAFDPAGEATPLVTRNLSSETVSGMARTWSRRALEQMAGSGRPVVSDDAFNDQRFRGAESITAQQIRSLLCAPIRLKGEMRGAIYVDTRGSSRSFTERDQAFASALAELSAVVLERSDSLLALQAENTALRARAARYQYADLIGASDAMQRLFERLARAVQSPAEVCVLITGENGTGKTQIARLLHRESPRRDRPFVVFGAGTVPESLAESQIFGHKKGSFTGADQDRAGLVERAESGTLFLDDVDALPPAVQPKLLSFLQEREYRPVGGELRRADVRVISATNQDLERMVADGRFRQDLYYRLDGLTLQVPPLRERQEDIPLIARHFVNQYKKAVAKELKGLSPRALQALLSYRWPGNVRELQSEIVQAVTMCGGAWIEPEDFKAGELRAAGGITPAPPAPAGEDLDLERALDRTTIQILRAALDAAQGNVSKAARAAAISRGRFYDLMKKLKIDHKE